MRKTLWAGLIAALAVVGSLAFACATPFAAIAALAASRMERSQGLMVVALAWLSNQVIGFAILGYPMTGSSFAWGIAIGLAALLAFIGAGTATASASRRSYGLATSFASSFVVYELALYVAGTVLSSSSDAFCIATVSRVFEINLISFVGLLLLHRLVVAAASLQDAAEPATSAG
jgi:hypothetical protein